jgi:hypothetical protein
MNAIKKFIWQSEFGFLALILAALSMGICGTFPKAIPAELLFLIFLGAAAVLTIEGFLVNTGLWEKIASRKAAKEIAKIESKLGAEK